MFMTSNKKAVARRPQDVAMESLQTGVVTR